MILKINMGSLFNCKSKAVSQDKENEKEKEKLKQKDKIKIIDHNFYDISLNIQNIKDIAQEGWEVVLKDQIEFKSPLLKIGIIGESKKGKTYILQKLLDIKINDDLIIKTKGLGVKYHKIPNEDFSQNNFVILDSEGIEKPVLDSENSNLLINNNNELNEMEELIKEKLLKELYFQHFIIEYSDIPILVVDEINFSEQKLLAKIQNILKNNKKPKKLFVIHNLKNYYNIQEIKNYINEILLNLANIKLKKREFMFTEIIDVNQNPQNESKNYIYYEQKLDDETYNIIHLVMANEFSSAGNYYNSFAIDYLKTHLNQFNDLPVFNIPEIIEENLIDLSNSIFNETMDKSQFNINQVGGKIIIKYNGKISYKNHLDYQLQTFNLYNNFITPEYRYYINNAEFIVELEVAGKTKDVACEFILKNGYYYFNFSGEKIDDVKDNLEIKNYYASSKNNLFKLNIAVSSNDIILKSDEYNLEDIGNGILVFKFELYQKSKIKKTYE